MTLRALWAVGIASLALGALAQTHRDSVDALVLRQLAHSREERGDDDLIEFVARHGVTDEPVAQPTQHREVRHEQHRRPER